VPLQSGFTGSERCFRWSLSGVAVLVDEAGHGVAALDPGVRPRGGFGVVVRGELVAALVGPVVVEVARVVAEDLLGVTAVEKQDAVGAFLAH
jgi:hypothetical protein